MNETQEWLEYDQAHMPAYGQSDRMKQLVSDISLALDEANQCLRTGHNFLVGLWTKRANRLVEEYQQLCLE